MAHLSAKVVDLLDVLDADEVDAHGGDGEAHADVEEHEEDVRVSLRDEVPEPHRRQRYEAEVERVQPPPALQHREQTRPQRDVDQQDPEHQHHRYLHVDWINSVNDESSQ